jgi:hypothetical protein
MKIDHFFGGLRAVFNFLAESDNTYIVSENKFPFFGNDRADNIMKTITNHAKNNNDNP